MPSLSLQQSVEVQGHVSINESAPEERFQRYVEQIMKGWIQNSRLDGQLADMPCEYEVAFFEEDTLDEVSCLIVVQAGEQLWRAWESADTPKMALRRSLERLHVEGEDQATSTNQSSQSQLPH